MELPGDERVGRTGPPGPVRKSSRNSIFQAHTVLIVANDRDQLRRFEPGHLSLSAHGFSLCGLLVTIAKDSSPERCYPCESIESTFVNSRKARQTNESGCFRLCHVVRFNNCLCSFRLSKRPMEQNSAFLNGPESVCTGFEEQA